MDSAPGASTSSSDAHTASPPHWSFVVTLIVLAVAFGNGTQNVAAYAAEVLVALSAVAVSPTVVKFTPRLHHFRQRVMVHHHHRRWAAWVAAGLILLAAASISLIDSISAAPWVAAGLLLVAIFLFVAVLMVSETPGHEHLREPTWSDHLSHWLHTPAFAGLLFFAGMMTSVVVAWAG